MTRNSNRRMQVPLAREVDGTHALVVIRTDDEETVRTELFSAVPSEVTYRAWSAVRGLVDGRLHDRPVTGSEHAAAALAWLALKAPPERSVTVFYELGAHLEDAATARALREALHAVRQNFGVIVLVESDPRLPAGLEMEAHRWSLPVPGRDELEQVIRGSLREARKTRSVTVEVRRSTLDAMIRNLHGLTRRQVERVVFACIAEDDRFDASDLDRLVLMKRNALGDLGGVLEFIEAPVSLDEIGGMASLKRWLAARRESMSEEAIAYGLRPPRGVLMLGVPGAGKSLAAKAIATAWNLPLLRLDAGALFDKFIGESERKLRDSLTQADRMAPAVLWIDEIEKGFAGAASHSSDGGLSRRMFGSLLTWMQERTTPIFLAATANDVSALPPELLRKGRFDEIFFVDLPAEPARESILSIHLRRRRRDPAGFDVRSLARSASGFSGAEIELVVDAALHRAFADDGREPTTDDLLHALRSSPPLSVVMAERIDALRAWAATRCVPAD